MHFKHKNEDEDFCVPSMKKWCGTALEDNLQGYKIRRCCTQMLQGQSWSRKERKSQKTADALPENTTAGATHAVTSGTAGIRDSWGLITPGKLLAPKLLVSTKVFPDTLR